ncbi:MAG TPA: TonB-dependent receptor [bacterium]|nr:TonB-dependent receptor [bacterium]HPR88716.1 TonB-dependent receptor [bacterium]
MKKAFIVLLTGAALLGTLPARAQNAGKIAGVISDRETGAPLPGANILVQGTSLGAVSDPEGRYMILHVPSGHYTLQVSLMGYRRVTIRDVEVLTDLTTPLSLRMAAEAVQMQEVVITAERPLVRKDLTSSEARIQADRIAAMPVQELGEIIDLQAGITRDSGGGLHIRGGRSSEVAYMVNGISITDDYNRSQSLTVENESVQELQVVSGTFNAEYGNAMSGIINIITRTGGSKLSGRVEAWSGDYVSSHKNIFWNIDDLNPLAENNLQATLSGPIRKDRLTFFLTGRRYHNEGWLYGPLAYLPGGRVTSNGRVAHGDSSPVAMNGNERWSGQGALKYKISRPLSLKFDLLGSSYDSHWYNHSYRLNPQGLRGARGYGATAIANLTHLLSPKTFYEAIFSCKYNQDLSRLYDDPEDARYVHPDSLTAGTYAFIKAGTDSYRSRRKTGSFIGKLDLTSQVTPHHQAKTGIELQHDRVEYETLTLVPATDASGLQLDPYKPALLDISTSNHALMTRRPDKFAAYIQDKIEYDNVIINVGLRFDYFLANGHVPADPRDPNIYNPMKLGHIYKDLNGDGVIGIAEQTSDNAYTLAERESFWFNKTSAKSQWSPRFGIGYPITDKGIIHFSYGIFQQIPEYSQLYEGDQIKLSEGQGIWGPYGNPDLKPQRTTMYELGLKQQIASHIGIDVTGYYRDIRDWISTSAAIPTWSTGVTYSKKINRDFANVKGIALTVTRQLANSYGFDLDYTYQIVQGTNSSPEDEYLALNNGVEPKKSLSALDWDQRHACNFTFYFQQPGWGWNAIVSYNSGQPYTPEIISGTLTGQNVLSGLATNSRIKPGRFSIDLNAFKRLALLGRECEFFARVYNLLDARNPLTIWADSGKPDYTFYEAQATEADPSWFLRPDYYSEPRRIQFGMRMIF